jgi:dethiobiotin synthetase
VENYNQLIGKYTIPQINKMKKVYFITATNTNIGKTYASSLLCDYFLQKGYKVAYFKPIETGVNDIALDANLIFNKLKIVDTKLSIQDIILYQFSLPAAPFVANKLQTIDIDKIILHKNKLLQKYDIILIEGAGGLMVPINKNYFMIDLIKDLNVTKTILITPSKLGCINDTMLNLKLLNQYKLKYNWFVNLYEDKNNFYQITYPFYKEYFGKINILQNKKDLDEVFFH